MMRPTTQTIDLQNEQQLLHSSAEKELQHPLQGSTLLTKKDEEYRASLHAPITSDVGSFTQLPNLQLFREPNPTLMGSSQHSILAFNSSINQTLR